MIFSERDLLEPAVESVSTIEWEETNCLLCGGGKWSQLVEAPDNFPGGKGLWFAVVQCLDCGLCFTNPRPSARTMSQFYPPSYKPHRAPNARNRKKLNRRPVGFRAWLRKERQALAWHGHGRLLDFGCGAGSFLERMHRRGWQVTGLDANPAAVERIRSEMGLEALVGTLPHPALSSASFDVVTMWESLEHVHDPLKVLKQAKRLLVPGGKLIVTVPNIDSLAFRTFGHAWYGLDLPRHLTHFAPWTLRILLHRAGFSPGPIRMVRHSHWLRWSAKLAARYAQPTLWHRLLQTKPVSRLLTWYSSWSRQADCMFVIAENCVAGPQSVREPW